MSRISSLSAHHSLTEYGKESSSCFKMLTLFGTLHHYNDLNMTEGMRARANLKFFGRKISYETIFYLPEILDQFLNKDDHVRRSRAARY